MVERVPSVRDAHEHDVDHEDAIFSKVVNQKRSSPANGRHDHELEISDDVKESLQVSWNCSRCTKMFTYHFFYPFSIPAVVFVEGWSIAYAMRFLLCFDPNGKCLKKFKGVGFNIMLWQLILQPLSLVLTVLVIALYINMGELPCAAIVKANIMVAVTYHFVRLVVISIKYGLAPDHEYAMLKTRPFSEVGQMWMTWHLLWWAFPKSPNDLRKELQIALLREGIDAPNQNVAVGSKYDGFNFWLSVSESTEKFLSTFPTFEKDTERGKNRARYPLRDISISALPPKIRAKMDDLYDALRRRTDRSFSDFRDFKAHFTVVTIAQSGYMQKGTLQCELCIEGREVVLQAIGRDIKVKTAWYISGTIVMGLLQASVPWIVVLLNSKLGFSQEKAIQLAKAAFANAANSSIGFQWTCRDYIDGNFQNLTIYNQIMYSSGQDPTWQGMTMFCTIIATILIYFYAQLLYFWLVGAVMDYRRRAKSLKAFDALLKPRYTFVSETRRGGDGQGTKQGIRAKQTAPVLLLDSPINVYSFVNGRKIIKKIGLEVHYRAQLFTGMLGMAFVVIIALMVADVSQGQKAKEQDEAIIAAAVVLFVGTGLGISEMIHQGYLANYQSGRVVQSLHRQRMMLTEQLAKGTNMKHHSIVESATTSIEAGANQLRLNWERQPIRMFYIPAGWALVNLFRSGLVAVAFLILQRYGVVA